MIINKSYRDHYAYDLSKNIEREGELWDDKSINQSIEMILGTYFGERLFNPSFGSEFSMMLFENITAATADRLIDSIINSIKRWEDRVQIIDSQVRMKADPDSHTIELTIPYIIKRNNIVSMFSKKIML